MTHTAPTRRSFLQALAGSALGAVALTPLEARARQVETAARTLTRGSGTQGWATRLREEYLLSPDLIYLNHASIGTVPRAVHEARVELLRLCEANPWLHMWGGAWEGAREDARTALARYLGADPAGMTLTHNTTEGFNLLGNGLALRPGDEVVFSSLNHDGASVTWTHNARRRGFRVRRVPFPVLETPSMSGAEVVEWHLQLVGPRTRVLVLPHVDNMVGIRHDVAAIARGARAAGVEIVAVDGAQSAGMLPVSISDLDVDLFAGSPHKWIQSAKGLGFAWLSPSLQERLEPMWVTWGQARWAGTVRRFEDYGTRNLAETVNLVDAVTFQEGLRGPVRARGYRQIRDWMRDRVESSSRLVWRSPLRWEDGASLVAVSVRGRPAGEVAAWLLREHGVVVRAFGEPLDALRISPHLMTTEEELERVLRWMEEVAA